MSDNIITSHTQIHSELQDRSCVHVTDQLKTNSRSESNIYVLSLIHQHGLFLVLVLETGRRDCDK